MPLHSLEPWRQSSGAPGHRRFAGPDAGGKSPLLHAASALERAMAWRWWKWSFVDNLPRTAAAASSRFFRFCFHLGGLLFGGFEVDLPLQRGKGLLNEVE